MFLHLLRPFKWIYDFSDIPDAKKLNFSHLSVFGDFKNRGFLNTAQLKTALQVPLKTAHFTAKYAYFRLLSFFLACGRIRIAAGKKKPFPNTALNPTGPLNPTGSFLDP